MEIELEKLLPLTKVEHGSILSAHGDITIAFAVTLPEIFTLSAAEYEALHQALIKAIRLLPKHSVYHQQDWFLEARYEPSRGAMRSFYAFTHGGHYIWGATAAMLVNLVERIGQP